MRSLVLFDQARLLKKRKGKWVLPSRSVSLETHTAKVHGRCEARRQSPRLRRATVCPGKTHADSATRSFFFL